MGDVIVELYFASERFTWMSACLVSRGIEFDSLLGLMKDPHRQLLLKSGFTLRTAWVPESPKLKVGASITLKDDEISDRWWEIKFISKNVTDKSKLNRSWHNNI